MKKSIDKEKSSVKTFSALDKIKKSNKVQDKTSVIEKEKVNIDDIFTSKPIIKIEEKEKIIIEVAKNAEPEEIILKEKIVKDLPKKNIDDEKINIASILKVNNTFSPENIEEKQNIIDNISNTGKSSATIAKERLTKDLLLNKSYSHQLENFNNEQIKRKNTASENLNDLLGSPQEQVTVFENEEEIVLNKKLVKNPIFIPWEKATKEEKSKARKVMSAGVVAGLATLTFFTFH